MELADIQSALRDRAFDGWLFYDFRGSDPLAASILGLRNEQFLSRRWFYFLPSEGEATKIVHAIESGALDSLPGRKRVYLPWGDLRQQLAETLAGRKRVAMQYSPMNAIPYISRVDAGTVELVRSLGVDVVSSADLVQQFEATLSDEQYASHIYAADAIAHICAQAFEEVGAALRAGKSADECSIQQFILHRFEEEGLETDHPPIVAIDAHAADPHFAPSPSQSIRMAPGESLLIDLWAKRRSGGSIYADITRVGFIGSSVPAEYQKVFKIVTSARDAAVDAVRQAVRTGTPITGAELDDVCRGVIRAAGFGEYFIHRTGHSIHQSTHGNGANIDNLETHDERRLLPRTLFSIEPGIYLPGRFGIRSEINVYLSERDAIVTGPEPQHEVVLIQ